MATNKHSIKGYLGSVASITGVGSGGALDFTELSAKTVDVSEDSVAILDATDDTTGKEAIADIVDGIAGTQSATGLTDSSGVITVSPADFAITIGADSLVYMTAAGVPKKDLATDVITAVVGTETSTGLSQSAGVVSASLGYTEAEVDVANDDFVFRDHNASHAPKTEAVADLVTALAGTETTSGITATSGVLKATLGYTGGSVDVANDDIVFRDHDDAHNCKTGSISGLVSGIGGVAATTGLSNTSGVLSVAAKIAHLVADEKSSIFIETGEFDFSGSADAVDTNVVTSMAAKGQLLFGVLVVSQVANGTTSNVISISSAPAAGTKMATDMTLTIANAYQNTVGSPIFMWPVATSDSIVASGGDVYLYAGASAGRNAGKVNYILVFRKTA